jgi:hypothetical protein
MFDRTRLRLKDGQLFVFRQGEPYLIIRMRIYTNSHKNMTKVFYGPSMHAAVYSLLKKQVSWNNIASTTFEKHEGHRVVSYKFDTPFWKNFQKGLSGKLERRRVTKVQLQYDA